MSHQRITNEKSLSLNSPSQKKGEKYEVQAANFLTAQGLLVLYKNWLQPHVGEIDIIMLEKNPAWDVLVFVEVRARKVNSYTDAIGSISKAKQKKIVLTAKYFLQQHPHYQEYECRFDIIAYDLLNDNDTTTKEPQWLQGAFYGDVW